MSEEKQNLRRQMKKIMDESGEKYRKCADQKIAEHILSSELYRESHVIFTFATMMNEIDVWPVINAAINDGKLICAPKCRKDRKMDALKITGPDDLVPGVMDVPEPRESCQLIKNTDIDLALIPCLGADEHGYRIGYGGGYYDNFLKDFGGDALLLCREKQFTDNIPKEPHDIPVKFYVNENGLFRAR